MSLRRSVCSRGAQQFQPRLVDDIPVDSSKHPPDHAKNADSPPEPACCTRWPFSALQRIALPESPFSFVVQIHRHVNPCFNLNKSHVYAASRRIRYRVRGDTLQTQRLCGGIVEGYVAHVRTQSCLPDHISQTFCIHNLCGAWVPSRDAGHFTFEKACTT